MRIIFIILFTLSLAGCAMSYDEVSDAKAWCESKGLRAEKFVGAHNRVTDVQCVDTNGSWYDPQPD